MQSGEQPEWEIPFEVGCNAGDTRVAGQLAAYTRIQRRAAVAVDGLPLEDLALSPTVYLASAAFACCTISPNFAGSAIARSARTLRSSSTFAAFRPAMNWLYDNPFARAPALMRMIPSFRNSRLRTLRSRYAYASERSTCSLAYV